MDGNEIKCFKCMEEITDKECYECDCCQGKIHKQCITLSSSEMRVIPLQKRLLMFVCDTCKKLFTKIPYIVGMLETIKTDVDELKSKISQTTKNELHILHQTMARNSEILQAPIITSQSYADIVNNKNISRPNSNIPSLIIKPKNKQRIEKTKEDLYKNIKPAELKIGVKNTRETKTGGIIVKCQTLQEIEKLQAEAERTLSTNYDVHVTKLRKPKIKIIGYDGEESEKQIERDLREQNSFITEMDKLKVTFIRKHRNSRLKTIFAECSPELFHKIISIKKVFLNWQRYRVFEDLSIPRCFRCQDFYHKNSECSNGVTCEFCMGDHEIHECQKISKKCKNCVEANLKYNTKYNTEHETSNQECPSYNYLLDILRSKIDYGQ